MKFYCFHFMPYLHAPVDFRERGQKSLWMVHPNDYFDARKCLFRTGDLEACWFMQRKRSAGKVRRDPP